MNILWIIKSYRNLGLALLAFWVLVSGFFQTFGTALRIGLVKPVEYQLREWLELTPPLNSRLKILALDDRSLTQLGRPVLGIEEWRALLKHLEAEGIAMVFIDALLSLDWQVGDAAREARLWENPGQTSLSVPVYSGAFFSSQAIAGRQAVPAKSKLLPSGVIESQGRSLAQRLWGQTIGQHLYGFAPPYAELIRGLGGIGMLNDGRFRPLELRDQQSILPHLSAYAGGKLRYDGRQLLANGKLLPLDSDGMLAIDFRSPETFNQITRSLHFELRRALRREESPYLESGDVVLIIPGYYTGNSDFFESSPFGRIPGGQVIATAIDGFLSQGFVREVGYVPFVILLMMAFALVMGLRGHKPQMVVMELVIVGVALVVALLSFCFLGISWPWLPAVVSYAGFRIILEIWRHFKVSLENQKLAGIARVMQGVAHDIRKPFAIWSIGSRRLQLANSNLELRKIVTGLADEISYSAKHVEAILSDILAAGGPAALEIEPIRLVDMISDMVAIVSRGEQPVTVAITIPEDIFVAVDSNRFVRALSNLLQNAYDAVSEGGRIWVSECGKDNQGFVAIEIGNTASSDIDKKVMAKMFEPFFTQGKAGGTGLGLYIANKVVREHGGNITCLSTGGSTRFRMRLPLCPAPDSPSTPVLAIGGEEGRSRPILILVEDCVFIAEVAIELLSADFAVRWFGSPKDFWAADGRGEIDWDLVDTVVMDYYFKNDKSVTGADLARELRRSRRCFLVLFSSVDGHRDDVFDLVVPKGDANFADKISLSRLSRL